MKKTLFAIALLFASTGVFAQLNKTITDAPHAQKVSDLKISNTYMPKAKKTAVKGTVEGATILTSFAPGTFTVGTMPNHSGQGEYTKWLTKSDTNSVLQTSNWVLKNGLGLSQPGNWYVLENPDLFNMSVHDGFAYIDFLSIMSVDAQNNTIFNAWIKANQSIKTYGKRGIDIYVSQFLYKFNSDKYYIEWSHDENFATKDSMEFNIKNIDVDVNDFIRGTAKITLPTNTSNCPLISTTPDENTWFRIRVVSPASQYQPQGYAYIVDDLAWAETPENRLEVLNCTFYGGYHGLPEIVTPEPFWVNVRLNNSGSKDLTNVTLRNLMLKGEVLPGASYDGSDSTNFDFTSGSVVENTGIMDSLRTAAYEAVGLSDINLNDKVNVLRDYEYLNAYEKPQLNQGEGVYGVKNRVTYKTEAGQETTVDASPYDYHYNVTTADENGSYNWRRDANISSYANLFNYGYIQQQGQVYLGEAAVNTKGYKVCLGFNARDFSSDVYAWGINVYPAVDSATYKVEANRRVKAGAIIKGSLWKFDPAAADNNTLVTQVLDLNNNPLESEPYTVQTSDYNTMENADQYGRVSGLKPIYLPFASHAAPLEKNTIYYACYEQVINGTFAIAQNYDRFVNVFYPGISRVITDKEDGTKDTSGFRNVIVWSPNITVDGKQYPWGFPFLYNYTPFIRLVIAKQQSGLSSIANNTASINLFPNPAKDNSVLDYTLSMSGNVTIDVTDLMGRKVLSYNEGLRHAGVNNKANIEVNKLANGTYFCTVNVNGAKVSTAKLVVNR